MGSPLKGKNGIVGLQRHVERGVEDELIKRLEEYKNTASAPRRLEVYYSRCNRPQAAGKGLQAVSHACSLSILGVP
ncbi:MAG: hypothetical protein QXF90_01320 [Thermofilaceae archaeon]